MARNYGKIEVVTWQNPKFRALSDDGKLLYLYLIACPHGNAIGCFRLPLGYVQDDLQWNAERVFRHVSELVSRRMIERDEATSLTFLAGWWGHNTIENAFVAKGALKVIEKLPRCAVFNNAIKAIDAAKDKFTDTAKAVFRDVSKYMSKDRVEPKEPEPEPEPVVRSEETPKVVVNSEQASAEKPALSLVASNPVPPSTVSEPLAAAPKPDGDNFDQVRDMPEGLVRSAMVRNERETALRRASTLGVG